MNKLLCVKRIRVNILYLIIYNVFVLFMAVLSSLVVTNTYYAFYSLCTGSSAGVAFSLTVLFLPICVLLCLFLGWVSAFWSKKSGKSRCVQIVSQQLTMFVVAALFFLGLMASFFPISNEQAMSNECPRWLLNT